MAHLWTRTASGWGARKLGGAELGLTANAVCQTTTKNATATHNGSARLVHINSEGTQVWALIAPLNSDVCVNGGHVRAGVCVLADRDEIRIEGEVKYFSTETLAVVEPFPGTGRPVYCVRCRLVIEVGTPSVCCPRCSTLYHESDSADLRCWTYSERCALCPQSTALDAGFIWTPEEA